MLKQFNRFLILAVLIGIALYITLTNSDPATIKLGPRLSLTTYAGVIYIGVFVTGCIVASLVALFFGFKSYLRERKLWAAEKGRRNFLKTLEQARGLMASGEWASARLLWEEIISRDPENVIARVELSQCLEQLGDEREALRVLDATRASSRTSSEVLFRAAALNHKVGNNTAALDNLSMIINDAPSRKALELARDSSRAMGRFDEALRFHDELEKIGYFSDESARVRTELLFNQLLKQTQPEGALRDSLSTFVKQHATCMPALEKLAELEKSRGDIDRCAESLVKAAKASGGDLLKWKAVVELWLHSPLGDTTRRSERALAAARSATKETRGRARVEAELLLIQTLLAVNHFQEAESLIESCNALATKELGGMPADLSQELVIQKGYCLSQMGNVRETASLWEDLASLGGANSHTKSAALATAARSEPSPILSTP
jgi:tetratricopeptide (TPR) repeat protein